MERNPDMLKNLPTILADATNGKPTRERIAGMLQVRRDLIMWCDGTQSTDETLAVSRAVEYLTRCAALEARCIGE